MNNEIANHTTTHIPDNHHHKVLFKPKGILAYVNCILPNGAILKFDRTGDYACACFDNLIDFNTFKTGLAKVKAL